MQQVKRELLIGMDVELLHIDLREDVERRFRFDRGDAWNIVEHVVHQLALIVDAAAGHQIILDALMAAQCGLHHRLRRHVRAHTHVGQHVQTLDVILGETLVAAQHHPADTPAGDHMGLRQSGERHAEQVRRKGRDGDVLQPIHDQTVVDLIREDHELVLSRKIDNLLKHFFRIQRAGRIVRIDDDDRLGLVGNLGTHVVDVRIPFGILIADVMHRGSAGQIHASCPQRIIRRRHEYLVAVVQQRG